MNKHLLLLARILISAIFVMSGFMKIMQFEGSAGWIASAGFPAAALLLTLAIVFELVGGLSVLLGWRARWGALVLIIFTVVATFMFHMNLSDQTQMAMFMKNVALVGGLIYVMQFGAGPMSLDKK